MAQQVDITADSPGGMLPGLALSLRPEQVARDIRNQRLATIAHGRALQRAALRDVLRQLDASTTGEQARAIVLQACEDVESEMALVADQVIADRQDDALIETLSADLTHDQLEGLRDA